MTKKKDIKTAAEPLKQENTLKKVYPGMIDLPQPPVFKNYYDYERNGAINLSGMNKDDLLNLVRPLITLIKNDKLTVSPLSAKDMKSLVPMMQTPASIAKLLKEDLSRLYNSFSLDITNIPAAAAVDAKYKVIWEKLLMVFDIDRYDLDEMLGRDFIFKRASSWGYSYVPEVLFFPLNVTAYSYGRSYYDTYYLFRVSVAQKYRKKLTEYFFGADILKPKCLVNLPDDENLKVEDFEPWIANDLVTLSGMALNGSMLTANGSIAASSVKKLKKQVELKEFTPVLDEWPLDRVELLALTYFIDLEEKALKKAKVTKGKKKKTEPEVVPANDSISVKDFAKFAVDEMPRLISSTRFNSFLPALQGFTKTWSASSFAIEITDLIFGILKAGHDAWQSLYNFRLRILCASDNEHSQILKLFTFSDRSKSRLQRRSEKEIADDEKIKAIDWFEEVGFRFILNWIKYLCALGIVEIAMEKGLKSADDDPLAGMRYVRLTPLGLYAFGLADSYQPKTVTVDNGIEFDAENGIITLPSVNSPYSLFLATVARKISPVRFAISTESLMKGCRSKTDLDNRIASLRTVVNLDTEPGLKRIVDDALGRTDCMEREGGYSLLRIRKHLPEITRLIATDKTLRQIALPASRGMLLVKTANLDKFYAACAASGYLIE